MVKKDEDDETAINLIADAYRYEERKDYTNAFKSSLKVVEICPDSFHGWVTVGFYANDVGEFDKMLEAYVKSLELFEKYILSVGGNFMTGESWDEKTQKENITSLLASTWISLGTTYSHLKKFSYSVFCYNTANMIGRKISHIKSWVKKIFKKGILKNYSKLEPEKPSELEELYEKYSGENLKKFLSQDFTKNKIFDLNI